MSEESNPNTVSRRDFVKAGLTAGAVAAVAGTGASLAKPRPLGKPNLLLIMTDQQRGDCVSAAGNPSIMTPSLDRLAREGVLFRNAYSCVPSCTPARTALLTGLAPWRNGILGYGRVGEGYAIEMPSALRSAGYYTTGIGKMHWHPQRNKHGFHRTILDESGREQSIDFRSDYRSWLFSKDSLVDPDLTGLGWNDFRGWPYKLPEKYHPTHWTGDRARQFIESYDRSEPFFLKVSFARPHSPYDPPQRFWDMYNGADLPEANVGDWAGRYEQRSDDSNSIWHGDLGAGQVRTSRQGYYANITFIDEKIPVELRDILPTFMDAAGVPGAETLDGKSMLALIENRDAPWRTFIDLEHDRCYHDLNHWTAVTDGHNKFIFHCETGEEQFFDLDTDRGETRDLAKDPAYRGRVSQWRQHMVDHLSERGEPFVKDGKLGVRRESYLYSPNWPGCKCHGTARRV